MSEPRMRQPFLFILSGLLLASLIMGGCSSRLVGEPIDEDNIPKIAVGKTTREEILELFGSPYRIETKGDEEILTYLYGSRFTWTMVLYTETREKADILDVFIDQKGIVSNYTFSKGVATPDIYKRPGPPY